MKTKRRAIVALSLATTMVSLLAGCNVLPLNKPVSHQTQDFGSRTVVLANSAKHRHNPPENYSMELGSKQHPTFYVNLHQNIYYTDRVVIVSFHDMSLHLNSMFNMSPATFAQDLQILQQYHFNVISNQQYIDWTQHRSPIPPNAVLLTFDDGYRSMYTHAFPILMKYHMPGTFFIITHFQDIGSSGFMTWPEVQAMAKAGMTIESHTYNLHYLVTVNGKLVPAFDTPYYNGKMQTPAQFFARDYRDFLLARLQIQQHLGRPIDEIAWPYGYGTLTAYEAAKAAGYQYFFTTASGPASPGSSSWYIHRIDVGLYTNPAQVVNKILLTAGSPAELVPSKPSFRKAHSA
ncbi:polysaccharide deacetylase family protein [Alicyclobacillus tolerans]|uniref:polysaccharide deacetylase family protein n=1 Tax=Alicyclobacillus tolerans TaxID=90970 RepID=UPI001F030270|nr:polysaccharide deacetylase family protein [Alicyclobacillus tolerans]MCF8565402.1 polysaccharide deacetylase family protein [Alicyclobacillus tolerans]